MSRPFCIAVAGPPGSGKSTLCATLAERLPAAFIEYDAYDTLAELPPDEAMAWLAAGAAYEAVDLSELVADLRALGEGEPILDRRSGAALAPASVVVLETPFGRAHPATAARVDLSVFLDTPPDLALARKLREIVGGVQATPADAPEFLRWLDGYLTTYETLVRPAIAVQRERVLPLSDLVFGPESDMESMVTEIVRRAGEMRG